MNASSHIHIFSKNCFMYSDGSSVQKLVEMEHIVLTAVNSMDIVLSKMIAIMPNDHV